MENQCSRCKGITHFPLVDYEGYRNICVDCFGELKHNWLRK